MSRHTGHGPREPVEWEPDLLGDPWRRTSVALPPIRGERVIATLVASTTTLASTPESCDAHPSTQSTAVLYLHGFNDYFFHTHLATEVEQMGLGFFALDLHGYGRSTTSEETRNDCHSLREYGNDLAWATQVIAERGWERLLIMGHSTGGLIATLWAYSATGRARVDGLILNSPWFELNRPWFDRVIATRILHAVGEYATDYVLTHDPSPYTEFLHHSTGGQWDFDLRFKRAEPTPVRAGWMRAIRAGHARLARGLHLSVPVLLATSDASASWADPPDVVAHADTVLNVADIQARADKVGYKVTTVRVPGGVHDLALSNRAARHAYLDAIAQWLRDNGFIEPQAIDQGAHRHDPS